MKSNIKTHLAILLLAVLGGDLHAQPSAPPTSYRTILEGGVVEAVNSVKIENELEGTSTIVWIVEEGAQVKRGDPLVELDAGPLKAMINTAQIEQLRVMRDLAKAKGKLEVARTSNALSTKVALNAHQAAEANLKQFQAGGIKTMTEDLQARVAVAAERIRAAEKILTLKDNPALQVEVINAQATLLEAQRVMKLAQAELKQFQKHTAPQKLRDLQLAVAVAEAELANTEVNNKANLGAASHEVDLAENKLRAAESKIADLKQQLANAKIAAPGDGLVVYHVAESSRFGGSTGMIERGARLRKGQDILQIVDLSKLSVVLKVHESRILQVHKGAPVSVKLASLPGRSIRGVVSYIAPVASAAERFGSGKKVYKTQVRLLNPPAHLRPGATVIAEITLTPPPRPGTGSRPGIDRPGSGRPSGTGTRTSPIMRLDTNKDGKVSESEYGKMSERIRQFMGEFSALDSNGDGGITKDEADAARQRMIQRLQQGGVGGRGGSPTPPKENPEK